MIERYAQHLWNALYAQLAARPILALTIGYVSTQFVAAFVAAYQTEKARVAKVVSETVAELNERADEIEARTERAIAEEHSASFDAKIWELP